MSLTVTQCKQAQPGRTVYELHDGDGLVLRILPSGTKSWAVYYHDGGRKRRATVGRFPAMGLREARAERGRVKARYVRADRITVDAFAELYLDKWARRHKSDPERDQRILERDVLPHLGRRPVADVRRADCASVVDRVQARGTPDMAVAVLAVLRRLLSFAVERGVIDANPASGVAARPSPARERVLGASDLAAWWQAIHGDDVPAGPRLALLLVLATGQRLGEVIAMEGRDLDSVDALWEIPAAKAKNGHAHVVPLSGWAQGLIAEARDHWPHARRVIPVSGDTARAHMRAAVAAADLERTIPHDLRRTCATWLGRLGYSRTVQDKLLNHVDRSVGARYDRFDYLDSQREALEAWAAKVGEIVGADLHQSAHQESRTAEGSRACPAPSAVTAY